MPWTRGGWMWVALAAGPVVPLSSARITPLAQEHVAVFESPDPARIFCYTPGICRLETGRLVATLDLGGPGIKSLPEARDLALQQGGKPAGAIGKIFTSDDGGRTWIFRANFPFLHARPFAAGRFVYVLGQSGKVMTVRSADAGITWSRPAELTQTSGWHQSACNVHYARGCVYLVMEHKDPGRPIKGWAVGALAPVLMRGRCDTDLTLPENWTFAAELVFEDAFDPARTEYFGVPFLPYDRRNPVDAAPHRPNSPPGWLETNVLQLNDPDHVWHDPTGRTFHLWMRAHTAGTGYAAIAKVVEQADGQMTTMLEKAPSGKTVLLAPCPGGQMRFHVLYDEPTRLFWLLSTQATDSMTRADRLGADRFNLPNNERQRLQLHFSKNMIDWCFAGLVCSGATQKEARHYASMCIDGDDLCVLSRSGDARAKSAHDGNLITFHRILDFRKLVY